MTDWQPIETAPKDNHARLVWCPQNQCIYCVAWEKGDAELGISEGWSIFGGMSVDYRLTPTHWMPLPKPPQPHPSEAVQQ